MDFKWYFIESRSLGSDLQYVMTSLDNGLAPNRPQAISWSNDGLVYWRIYVSPGLNKLKVPELGLPHQSGDKAS